MKTGLVWTPSRFLNGEWEAEAYGVRYRVTSIQGAGRSVGAHFAAADTLDLGRFDGSPAGRQAAMNACQAHANASGRSLLSALPDSRLTAVAT